MQHEVENLELKIIDSDVTFESIYSKSFIPREYLDEIKQANFLLIPNENIRENVGPTFPETTLEFLDYIRENKTDNVNLDIAISDENFQRLELHSAVVVIATFIVTSVILPIAINLVSSYLYDQAKKHNRSNDDLCAEVNIIVQDGSTSKNINYKGPVSGIKETLDSVIPNLFPGDSENDKE